MQAVPSYRHDCSINPQSSQAISSGHTSRHVLQIPSDLKLWIILQIMDQVNMLTVEKVAYHTQAPFIIPVGFIHTFSRPPYWQASHTAPSHAGPPLPAKFTKIYKVRKLTSIVPLIWFHVIFVPIRPGVLPIHPAGSHTVSVPHTSKCVWVSQSPQVPHIGWFFTNPRVRFTQIPRQSCSANFWRRRRRVRQRRRVCLGGALAPHGSGVALYGTLARGWQYVRFVLFGTGEGFAGLHRQAAGGGGQAQLIVPRCCCTGRHLWQLWKLWQLGGQAQLIVPRCCCTGRHLWQLWKLWQLGGQAQLIVPRCCCTGRHLWQLWKLWQLGGQAQLIVPRCCCTGRHLWQLWKLWQLGGQAQLIAAMEAMAAGGSGTAHRTPVLLHWQASMAAMEAMAAGGSGTAHRTPVLLHWQASMAAMEAMAAGGSGTAHRTPVLLHWQASMAAMEAMAAGGSGTAHRTPVLLHWQASMAAMEAMAAGGSGTAPYPGAVALAGTMAAMEAMAAGGSGTGGTVHPGVATAHPSRPARGKGGSR